MNIQKTKALLSNIPANITVMLRGCHGLGKTEVVRQVAKEVWKQDCIEFQASQVSDVGDIIGLQKIDENGCTVWNPPFWFNKDKPVTLFLDELNRGTPLITNAMMQLALDHRILNFELPKGSHIVVAINKAEDGYDVEEFDLAKASRFMQIDFTPTVEEWLDWASKASVNDFVRGYIAQNPTDLDCPSNFNGTDNRLPCRRSWKHLSDTINNFGEALSIDDEAFYKEVVAGFMGTAIANKFVTYVKTVGVGITPKLIITTKDFENEVIKELKKYSKKSVADTINLGQGVEMFLRDNVKQGVDKGVIKHYAENYLNFLKNINAEARQQVFLTANAKAENRIWLTLCKMHFKELGVFMAKLVGAGKV